MSVTDQKLKKNKKDTNFVLKIVSVCLSVSVSLSPCLFLSVDVWMFVSLCVDVCLCVSLCVCVCVCVRARAQRVCERKPVKSYSRHELQRGVSFFFFPDSFVPSPSHVRLGQLSPSHPELSVVSI